MCSSLPVIYCIFCLLLTQTGSLFTTNANLVTSEALPDKVSSYYVAILSQTETLLVRLGVDWLCVTACLLKVGQLHFQSRQIISSFTENPVYLMMSRKKNCHKVHAVLFPWFSLLLTFSEGEQQGSVYLEVRQLILLWMNTVL